MMKKLNVMIFVALMAFAATSHGQKAEMLYFKANLPCCKAKSCNLLENNLKSIVENNFSNDDVTFRRVTIANAKNKELVNKYNAKSQSVIIVVNKMIGKDKSFNLSDMVTRYQRSRNKKEVEKEIVDKINSVL